MQWGDSEKSDSALVIEEIKFALTTQLKNKLGKFTTESRNCAALDTCFTSSVAGRPWSDMYVQELCLEDKNKGTGPVSSNRLFKLDSWQEL